MRLVIIVFILFFTSTCSNSGSSDMNINFPSLSINVSGLESPSVSYQKQILDVTSNNSNCNFEISLLNSDFHNIHFVKTSDNRKFEFRNPIINSNQENFILKVSSIQNADCPMAVNELNLSVVKYPTKYNLIPENIDKLKTNFYQISDIGFDGIIIKDTFSATECYPTPNDCTFYDNQLFGQDAHNMIVGDFNGDGFEDFAVAWTFFPHTIDPDQKINAPINIYLNNGEGRYEENLNIYTNNEPPEHPFAYRMIAADFNNDGIDDIFAGSMGIQYRSSDYSENYINPHPHLLLLSNSEKKFEDASHKIEDRNNGNGQLCNFAHDASAGDPDGDGDTDVYACNILNINDGNGNFVMHEYINLEWQRENKYGNPMSSLMTDLNNDSFDDIIFWNFDNRSTWSDVDEGYILLSNNSSDIKNWSRLVLPSGPFGYDRNKYNHAASGDLNNDGFEDVVVSITRDLPYYEGAYIQILINDGNGELLDMTNTNFPAQPRSDSHHGEGNIYLRDMNLDGNLDIIHSTRDYSSGYHGAHIAINDGNGNFLSMENSDLPMRPDPGNNNYDYLMKALPLNIDNEGCLDFISVTDVGWENSSEETSNYFFSVLNVNCNF